MDNFSQPVLEKCCKELLAGQVPFFVLDFHGVLSIEQKGIKALGIMNAELRNRPATLRVCLKSPELKDVLVRHGLVTGDEFRTDLEETLRGLAFKPINFLIKIDTQNIKKVA